MLNDCLNNESLMVSVVHCPTISMKADIFIKAMSSPKFVAALKLIMSGEVFSKLR